MAHFSEPVSISADLNVGGTIGPPRPRTELQTDTGMVMPIDLVALRVWDAIHTNLPAAGASDDLGITGGTFGTHAPKVTTGDLKTAGATTRRARFTLRLPPEYVAGGTLKIRLSGGMETAIADTTATVDLEAYVIGRDGTIDGSDLVSTAAQTINSLTFGDKDFTVTSTALEPGDALDVRLSVAVSDAAGALAVIATVGAIEAVLSIRG